MIFLGSREAGSLNIEKGANKTLKKGLVVTSCTLLVLAFAASAAPEGPRLASRQLLGDVSDGSRAVPVHVIPLFIADPLNEENVLKIAPDDEVVLPFSTRQTCGACHSYDIISTGWHFNAVDPNVLPGRPGQPWILVDASTGTQIPLSYRPWPGTFKPEHLGITPFQFTILFGRHMPGGGVGELDSDEPDEIARQFVSGKLEINCLACHNAQPGHDQAEYASQIARQNFRWAAAASCEFASVSGSAKNMPDTYDPFMPEPLEDVKKIPPTITYRKNTFERKNQVFFDIAREVPNERCFFCHSNVNIDKNNSEKWTADEDVHLTAGMTCVDCHREGLEHNTIRGYEGEDMASTNPLAATSTCQGCHLPKETLQPTAGRLGAPVPKHPGIPPIHFEKLTCTACHSGPWPAEKTYRGKTSRAHALGTHNVNKSPEVLPHIFYPVFAAHDGKIGPHKLIWPAYWGMLKDKNVSPIDLETARRIVGKIITKEKLSPSGDWPSLNEKDITEALNLLGKTIEGNPVYVCGGKLHWLDGSGQLSVVEDHYAARPYMWPFAHNVRPAAQSLGVRHCEDCHATDAPFFFGKVAVDSPLESERDSVKKMVEFQGINDFYAWAFAFSFVFRPWLKVVTLLSAAILAAVLLLYALKALCCIVKICSVRFR